MHVNSFSIQYGYKFTVNADIQGADLLLLSCISIMLSASAEGPSMLYLPLCVRSLSTHIVWRPGRESYWSLPAVFWWKTTPHFSYFIFVIVSQPMIWCSRDNQEKKWLWLPPPCAIILFFVMAWNVEASIEKSSPDLWSWICMCLICHCVRLYVSDYCWTTHTAHDTTICSDHF